MPNNKEFTVLIVPAVTDMAGQCRIVAREGKVRDALANYRSDTDHWFEVGLMDSRGRLVHCSELGDLREQLKSCEPLMAGLTFQVIAHAPEGSAPAQEATEHEERLVHDDHPGRTWDRNCPACNPSVDYSAASGQSEPRDYSETGDIPRDPLAARSIGEPGAASSGRKRQSLADRCEALVEWEPCDCGCPSGKAPKTAKDVALVQAAAKLRSLEGALGAGSTTSSQEPWWKDPRNYGLASFASKTEPAAIRTWPEGAAFVDEDGVFLDGHGVPLASAPANQALDAGKIGTWMSKAMELADRYARGDHHARVSLCMHLAEGCELLVKALIKPDQ